MPRACLALKCSNVWWCTLMHAGLATATLFKWLACRHLEGNFEASLIGNILRLGPLAVHHDALIPEAPVQVLNARGLAGELLRHLPKCCRCCI